MNLFWFKTILFQNIRRKIHAHFYSHSLTCSFSYTHRYTSITFCNMSISQVHLHTTNTCIQYRCIFLFTEFWKVDFALSHSLSLCLCVNIFFYIWGCGIYLFLLKKAIGQWNGNRCTYMTSENCLKMGSGMKQLWMLPFLFFWKTGKKWCYNSINSYILKTLN